MLSLAISRGELPHAPTLCAKAFKIGRESCPILLKLSRVSLAHQCDILMAKHLAYAKK
jgi:hypothetical protein